MPSVSVIIPTHSRPQLLRRAIDSALAAGADVEVVVVDDASTDETAEMCQGLEGIKYLRLEHNQGVAGARNAGLLASSAEYIALLDDDDVRLPGSLDFQLSLLREAPEAALVYGQALFGGAKDRAGHDRYPQSCPSGDIFWQLLEQNFVPSGSVVFRRECLANAGLFNCDIAGIDDWDLWVRIAALYPVVAFDQPVVIWRRPSPVSEQGSAEAVAIVRLATKQFSESWLKMPRAAQAPAVVRRQVSLQFSRNMASHLAWEAVRSLSYGKVLRANRCAFAAIRFHLPGIFRRAMEGLSISRARAHLNNSRIDENSF